MGWKETSVSLTPSLQNQINIKINMNKYEKEIQIIKKSLLFCMKKDMHKEMTV